MKLRASGVIRPPKDGEITRLMGNKDASTLLIAPPPTAVEVEHNLPWCNQAAQAFFGFLSPLSLTPDDFLTVPAQFNSGKLSNTLCVYTKDIIAIAAQDSKIRRFICVDPAVFKIFFGFGKKPPSSVMDGNSIATNETGFKPLFVFPDPTGLVPPTVPVKKSRDFYMALNFHETCARKMESLLPKFQQFMQI